MPLGLLPFTHRSVPRSSPTQPRSVAREPRTAPRTPRPPPLLIAELQLAIARTGIGLELTGPLALGCLTVRELSASLPHVRFPVDVSGGVARFRHRRGVVERVVLEAPRTALESWAAPRLRGVLGVKTPKVMLFVRRGGATVGVVDEVEMRCLAFEVEIFAEGPDVAVAVHDARGSGLSAPATALAIRAVHALAGDAASRAGGRFVLRGIAGALGRQVFPDRGARAPDAEGVVWGTVRGHDDGWLFVAQRGDVPCEPLASAVVAREACELCEAADDAAFALDLETARGLLVDALERAPSHRELSRRLAEVDRVLGTSAHGGSGRAEAALATLRDAGTDTGGSGALLMAELLRDTGDVAGAMAAFMRAGETQPVGPLAAMAFDAAASLMPDPDDALALLDRAVARAPALPGPRWTRLAARLTLGRAVDAQADAEHLEALATGARARHAVWLRAGRAFRAQGLVNESAMLFERALRYGPRDAEATAGLGAALVAAGKVTRGAELLTLAVAFAEAAGKEVWAASVDLALVLADALDDKPAAIARVRAVPSHAPDAVRSRALEGRWRAALGDIAGAGLSFARARDLIEARMPSAADGGHREAVAILLEGARLESDTRGDWLAAQRHLQVAIRIAPHDVNAKRAFREAGSKLAGVKEVAIVHLKPEPWSAEAAPTWMGHDLPVASEAPMTEFDEAQDHARVEELTRKLQSDPTNDDVVDELSTCLLRLGRTHELFALLSARLDEVGPERREALLPKQREVLLRLEEDARGAGRDDEAALFREAREIL